MNEQYILVQALRFFIPALCSMLFRVFALGHRGKGRTILCLTLFTLYMLVVPQILMKMMGYYAYTKIAPVVMMLGNVVVFFFSSDNFIKTAFLHLTQVNMVVLLSILCNALRYIIGIKQEVMLLVLPAVYIPALLVAIRYAAKPLRFIADNIHTGWGEMLIIPSATLGLALIVSVYASVYFGSQPLFAAGVVLASETCFFLYISILYQNLRDIYRLNQSQMEYKMQTVNTVTELTAYDDYMAMTLQTRKDLRRHNALLLEYLSQGDTAGAVAYLREYNTSLKEDVALQVYCENHTANALLRLYQRTAQEAGVTFDVQAQIPGQLPLAAPELGGVLSSLLENAFAACVKAGENSYIVFTAQCSAASLQIEIRNSVSGTISFAGGLPVSDKPGGGTGIKNVLSTVQAAGGMLQMKQKGAEFITGLVLPL